MNQGEIQALKWRAVNAWFRAPWVGLIIICSWLSHSLLLGQTRPASTHWILPPDRLQPVLQQSIDFLKEQVPAWPRENNCYACHHQGDGARALFQARRHGLEVPALSLDTTISWLTRPDEWGNQGGDPNAADPLLADIQFGATLIAMEGSQSGNLSDLTQARQRVIERLIEAQSQDGSWSLDSTPSIGTPGVPGQAWATLMAWQIIKTSQDERAQITRSNAEKWLRGLGVDHVPNAACKLIFIESGQIAAKGDAILCLEFLLAAQSRFGGWGPYKGSPVEVFDTSLALIALSFYARDERVAMVIKRGGSFLLAEQLKDGSWVETTRPPGGQSHAQWIATTSWAAQALMAIDRAQQPDVHGVEANFDASSTP